MKETSCCFLYRWGWVGSEPAGYVATVFHSGSMSDRPNRSIATSVSAWLGPVGWRIRTAM